MKGLLVIGIVCAMLLLGCAAQGAPAQNPPAQAPGGAANPAVPAQAPPVIGVSPPKENKTEINPPEAPAISASDALLGAMRVSGGWKVVYDVTAGSASSYEMTQYLKGSNIRTDMTASGMQARTYMVSGKVSSCVLAGTKWMCTDMTAQMGNTTSDLSQQLQSEQAKYTITADGTESIAGTTATCYKIVSSDGTDRYCISPEGVPLYIKTSAEGSEMVMQAKSYSTSVADSDFALPG